MEENNILVAETTETAAIENTDLVATELFPESEDLTVVQMPEEQSFGGGDIAAVGGVIAMAVGGIVGGKVLLDNHLDKIIAGEKETNSAFMTGLAAMRAKRLENKAKKKAAKEAKKAAKKGTATETETKTEEKPVETVEGEVVESSKDSKKKTK